MLYCHVTTQRNLLYFFYLFSKFNTGFKKIINFRLRPQTPGPSGDFRSLQTHDTIPNSRS